MILLTFHLISQNDHKWDFLSGNKTKVKHSMNAQIQRIKGSSKSSDRRDGQNESIFFRNNFKVKKALFGKISNSMSLISRQN